MGAGKSKEGVESSFIENPENYRSVDIEGDELLLSKGEFDLRTPSIWDGKVKIGEREFTLDEMKVFNPD